ncbi:hypothetical protein GCM10027294_53070 [Marinactinospora endophytica]
METVRPRRQKRATTGASAKFLSLQTKVPPPVHQQYKTAAKTIGVSLSVFLERLTKATAEGEAARNALISAKPTQPEAAA